MIENKHSIRHKDDQHADSNTAAKAKDMFTVLGVANATEQPEKPRTYGSRDQTTT